MARKEKTVLVTTEGRDLNKTFHITEMAAAESEEWAMRALLALARSGVELPDDFMSRGLAGIAVVGVQALGGLDYDVAKPLLAQMMACVQVVPDPTRPVVRRALIDDDIEEVSTRLFLRKEVLNLHIDFFTIGALRTSAAAALAPVLK